MNRSTLRSLRFGIVGAVFCLSPLATVVHAAHACDLDADPSAAPAALDAGSGDGLTIETAVAHPAAAAARDMHLVFSDDQMGGVWYDLAPFAGQRSISGAELASGHAAIGVNLDQLADF
jgi:hypothetical protein